MTIGLILLSAIIGAGCRRTSHNGKIDGFWRIVEIEYIEETGVVRTVTPDGYFIAIDLELLQLGRKSIHPPYMVQYQATGVMNYHKNAEKLGVDFRSTHDAALLLDFGVPTNPVVFDIETLTNKKMVLKTKTTRIVCSKF